MGFEARAIARARAKNQALILGLELQPWSPFRAKAGLRLGVALGLKLRFTQGLGLGLWRGMKLGLGKQFQLGPELELGLVLGGWG